MLFTPGTETLKIFQPLKKTTCNTKTYFLEGYISTSFKTAEGSRQKLKMQVDSILFPNRIERKGPEEFSRQFPTSFLWISFHGTM